jgi:hypothetical protein
MFFGFVVFKLFKSVVFVSDESKVRFAGDHSVHNLSVINFSVKP